MGIWSNTAITIVPTYGPRTSHSLVRLENHCRGLPSWRATQAQNASSRIPLQGDPTDVDEIQRCDGDEDPQNDSLRQRAPPNLLQGCARNARANQKQRRGQSVSPQRKNYFAERCG